MFGELLLSPLLCCCWWRDWGGLVWILTLVSGSEGILPYIRCHHRSFRGYPWVRLYPKLQSQPIGLPKIFIDYLFFQADQSDCTKSVSIFNRFASSEERWKNLSPLSFPTRGLGWLVNQRNPSEYWQVTKGDLSQIISSLHDSFLFRSSFFIRF